MPCLPRRIALYFALLLVLATGTACQSLIPLRGSQGGISSQTTNDSFGYRGQPGAGPVQVGVLLPLSGKAQPAGKALLNAAELALFEFGNNRLELRVHDTKGTPEGAAEAAQKAVADNVGLVIGPLFADSLRSAAPILRDANIMGVGFSNDVTATSSNMFAMGMIPDQEVTAVVRYAISKGITRFAAIAPESDYGQATLEALEQAVLSRGAQVVTVARYGPGEGNDPRSRIKELYNFNKQRGMKRGDNDRLRRDGVGSGGPDGAFQALLVAETGRELPIIAAQLAKYDMDNATVQILGTGRWDTLPVGREQSLVGAWYAAPDPNARTGFVERYQQTYKAKPLRIATLAYDAVALASTLAADPGGANFTQGALTDPAGFAGQDGVFRFDQNGVVERAFAIKQATVQGSQIIANAPSSFSALPY